MMDAFTISGRTPMLVSMKKLIADRSGATAVEYGLIAGLIAVAIVAALTALSGGITTALTNATTALTGG